MSFSLDIAKFANRAKENADKVVRRVVIDVGGRLVEKSPVGDPEMWENATLWKSLGWTHEGYVGGRFRANWQYGNLAGGGIPMQPLADIDPSGGVSISRISSGVLEAEPRTVHYLVNNLPYAQRLENGYSKQAPQGMVGLTVLEYKGIVQDAASAVKGGA